MRYIILLVSTMICQSIWAENFTCSDFADYEQEGFNSYFVAKMRNPSASESIILINYDKEADTSYFADIVIIDAASDISGFDKAYSSLANSTTKFLVKKYSNIMGFAHANNYLNSRNRTEISLYLSEIRASTIKRCENVVKTGEARNSVESLMIFLIKQKSDKKQL